MMQHMAMSRIYIRMFPHDKNAHHSWHGDVFIHLIDGRFILVSTQHCHGKSGIIYCVVLMMFHCTARSCDLHSCS